MAADKILGIDIGAHSIKIAQVAVDGDRPVVEAYTAVPLPYGSIVDGLVVPEKRPLIVEALRAVAKSKMFSTKDVIVGLNSPNSVFFHRTTVPVMSEEDLRKSLHNVVEAAETSLDVNHQQIAFSVLGRTRKNNKMNVMLFLVQDDFARVICEMVEEAGLNIVGADLAALATLRGAEIDHDTSRAQAIISIGADTQSILVHSGGIPLFLYTDTTSTGVEASRVIADALGLDDEDEEVEKMKTSSERLPAAAHEAITEYLTNLADRVVASFAAYKRSGANLPAIESILLVGGGSMLQGLARAIVTKADVPVQYARPDSSFEGDLKNAVFHLTALGLTTGAQE